jgi:hypothetical protein
MTPNAQVALATFTASIGDQFDAVRASAQSIGGRAESLSTFEADAVYGELRRAAGKLVSKNAYSSEDEAMTAVLKTTRGGELYSEYVRRLEVAQRAQVDADLSIRRRDTAQQLRKRHVASRMQWTADDFLEHERVQKAEEAEQTLQDDAHIPIDQAARKLMQRDPALSFTQACGMAVDANPRLYDDYVAKLNQSLCPEANPELNSSASGLANDGQLFGVDAAYTQRVRHVLTTLGPRARNWLRKELSGQGSSWKGSLRGRGYDVKGLGIVLDPNSVLLEVEE